jgi:anthranilate synthase/aminodeoxychorismate synthase-like glutamine amidotransferase
MILLIDNYDSFTYNIAQLIEMLGHTCVVIRNDKLTVPDIERLAPSALVLSPGPGRPEEAGIMLEIITHFSFRLPILGVCLGHQGIGLAFGAEVIRAPLAAHGKTTRLRHDGQGLFQSIKQNVSAARYHSLVVREETLPSCLEITARSSDGLIMGLRHRQAQIEGVQFHPESIATDGGKEMMANFLSLVSTASHAA